MNPITFEQECTKTKSMEDASPGVVEKIKNI